MKNQSTFERFNKFEKLTELQKIIAQLLSNGNSTVKKSGGLPLRDGVRATVNPVLQVDQNNAASVIQHAYRGWKIKQYLIKNPYLAYLSMLSPEDDAFLLSSVMFTRHAAEFKAGSPSRSENPYLGNDYHRDNDMSRSLQKLLLRLFEIEEKEEREYLAISTLHNTPLDEMIGDAFQAGKDYEVIEKAGCSIKIMSMPKSKASEKKTRTLMDRVRAFGLITSPWELAENIKVPSNSINFSERIKIPSAIPTTKEHLLKSPIFRTLQVTAHQKKYSTHHLSECLSRMLKQLPEDLPQEAVKRIALMVDITNTFYVNNYPRYAFYVYTVIHEISLQLTAKAPNPGDALGMSNAMGFAGFMDESRHTLVKAFGIDSISDQQMFVASPCMSGANAYAVARALSNKIQLQEGKKPGIYICPPCYYEFNSHISEVRTMKEEDADIFLLSAGPILNQDGLYPGTDINLFIKNRLELFKSKPITLIVDTTTALYKNLKLDADAQALITSGQLSIMLHESHQKFGLIHSDQALYGRMFGLCSKRSYVADVVRRFQLNAEKDFHEHRDMRIGAYISVACSDVLEEIKAQHFSNGAFLKTFLAEHLKIKAELRNYKDMLTNLDELYFVSYPILGSGPSLKLPDMVETRDSFGHYHTALIDIGRHKRLSPDASDFTDCLIQSIQMYLTKDFDTKDLLKILEEIEKSPKQVLPLEDQHILVALMNNILTDNSQSDVLERSLHLKNTEAQTQLIQIEALLKRCPALKGRQHYNNISRYLLEFKTKMTLLRIDNSHGALKLGLRDDLKKLIDFMIKCKYKGILPENITPILADAYLKASETIQQELRDLLINNLEEILYEAAIRGNNKQKDDIAIYLYTHNRHSFMENIFKSIDKTKEMKLMDVIFESNRRDLIKLSNSDSNLNKNAVITKLLTSAKPMNDSIRTLLNDEMTSDQRKAFFRKLLIDLPRSVNTFCSLPGFIQNTEEATQAVTSLLNADKLHQTITQFEGHILDLYRLATPDERLIIFQALKSEINIGGIKDILLQFDKDEREKQLNEIVTEEVFKKLSSNDLVSILDIVSPTLQHKILEKLEQTRDLNSLLILALKSPLDTQDPLVKQMAIVLLRVHAQYPNAIDWTPRSDDAWENGYEDNDVYLNKIKKLSEIDAETPLIEQTQVSKGLF